MFYYQDGCEWAKVSSGTGPLLFFILYIADRAVKYGVSLHAYADDTLQLYHALPSRRHGVIRRSSRALHPCHWMSANRLKLNVDKTELLFASSGHWCAALKGSYPVLKLGADAAVASSHVRLLGVDISLDLSRKFINH